MKSKEQLRHEITSLTHFYFFKNKKLDENVVEKGNNIQSKLN